MSEILFWTHSGVRYLVLLAGLVTALLAIMAGARPVSRGLRSAWSAFIGLLDVQVLIGLIVVFTRPFQGQYIGHLVMMLVALAVAHGTGVAFRRRPEERQTGRPILVGVAVSLALVVGGILSIGRSIV